MSSKIVGLMLVAVLSFAACGGDGDTATAEGGDGPAVVTSVYPLTWVTEQVAGDRARVVDLTPPGVEPHDLELTTSEAVELNEAELIVYIGEGFQPSIEDALGDIDAPQLDVLTDLETQTTEHDHAEEEGHEDEAEDEHGHEEGAADPHVWLDPLNMVAIAHEVAHELGEIDPDNAADYEAAADDLAEELTALDEEMHEGLENCERREIVVSHEAFGYLAAAYDLEQVGISGLDPEAEPSPSRLAEVEEFSREHEVTTIFFEDLVSPATAKTLADELGIGTDILSPLETTPESGDYLDAMRANLENLRDALGCD